MEVTLHTSIDAIDAAAWQALTEKDFPFADHAHLNALERTGCVGPEAGWIPLYLVARREETIWGALYVYLKNNSYGEFIFDHAWAQAYARHGVAYFPKMVSSVPFTPATGEKTLVHPDCPDPEGVRALLTREAVKIAQAAQCSSAHFLFIPNESVEGFRARGFLVRHSYQYHWHNRGYGSFEDFLAALKSKRRRQIALERRQVQQTPGLTIETIEGPDLTKEHAHALTAFYLDTNEKNYSHACLNQAFFEEVFDSMRENIVLFWACLEGEPVAAAINFRKGRRMYGRYWGCARDVRNLHFELCYYRAIEYAIEKGYERYEAGAQGEHKIPRGFVPSLTYSAHEVFHPSFREAIARYVEDEKKAIEMDFEEYAAHLPYCSET